MKFLIVFVVLFAVALAAPAAPQAEIVSQTSEVGPDAFNYAFETSDGVKAEEEGHLNNAGSDHEEIVVKGSYSFVGDDGQTYLVNYIADANGFQPTGAHLPVAPQA